MVNFIQIYKLVQIFSYFRVKPQLNGALPCPRSGHSSFSLGSKIYFFGGLNDSGYVSCDTICAEMSNIYIKKMIIILIL